MKAFKANYLSDSQQYQQLSELVRKSYEAPSDISLYIQIDQINQWIHSNNSNKPLLITSKQFGGKKTLLCQLIKHIQKTKNNFIVISQFASATPYYAQIIYKISMQLRTHLHINQKIQLNEEKLRQYFRYWLEIADEKIEKDYLCYSKEEKLQIVIIIQGVDKVVDSKNQNVGLSFWLPQVNLKNIKIILSADKNSNIQQALNPTAQNKIQFVIPQNKISTVKQKLYRQNPKLLKFQTNIHFGDLKIIKNMLDLFPKMQIQSKIDFQDFFKKYVKYASSVIGSQDNIYKMLGCLIWSKKGLTKNTIRRSYQFEVSTVQNFLQAFKPIILRADRTYLILNRRIKQYINKIILQKLSHIQQVKKNTHILLSKALKKQITTVNVLQQMICHLIYSYNFTQLKQLLSKVQNFLILYTPLTKHLLCVCWFMLEVQFQYDPVFQYNKAVERFLNHYYPSPQDTFKIIFQLSLFFKEYSEFQNSKTPQFRHPPIRGEVQHFQQISIYQELVGLDMYQKCKVKNKQTLKQNLGKSKVKESSSLPKQNDGKSTKKIQQQQIKSIEQIEQGNDNTKDVQKLNVRIKFHQDKFKICYLQQMKPYLDEFYVLNTNSSNAKKRVKVFDEEQDDSQNQMDQNKIDIDKIKKALFLKRYSDYCQQQYHRTSSQKRSFYYYKQWIWMQFPWVCQSINNNYSQLIKKCMKSPTQYMPLDLQSKLIGQAIRISKIAKQSKKQIYDAKRNQTTLINQTQHDQMTILQTKTQIPNQTQRSIVKHKTTTIPKQQFNLSNLDEELKNNPNAKSRKKIKANNQLSTIFMTDISMTQSHIQDKQNIPQRTNRLPTILRCSSLAASRISKTGAPLDVTQTRDYGLLVTKYDQIKHENQQLVAKIQSIKQNRSTLKQNNKQFEKQVIKAAMEQLKEKKAKIAKSYKVQEALKGKLQMIIKLCDINKSHGSQSADLNNFLSSLKNMFKIQQQNLQNINQNTKKMLQQNKSEYKKAKEQKLNITQKLKKEKSKLEKSHSISIPQIQIKEQKKNKAFKKYNKSISNDNNKKHKLEKQLQQLNETLNIFEKQLGLKMEMHKQNQVIFQKYSQSVDKLNEIQWKLSELMDQNSSKQSKLLDLEQKLNINKGHREHVKQVAQRSMQSMINNSYHNAEQRIKCLQKCFTLIDQKKSSSVTSRDS